VPRKRQFRRLRRLRLIGGSGVIAMMLGGAAAFFAAGDAAHHRPGGMVGVLTGVVLVAAGAGVMTWALRAFTGVAESEWQELRARGGDDGLPLGAFRQGQRVGLEASDGLLIFGVVSAGIGVLFLVSGITDSHVGWRFGLGFSLIGFVPAALFFRLGTGVKYWLTPEGVAKRARLQPSVYWDDVERIVPVNRGIPVAASDYMDALELEVRDPKQAQRRRWLATDFTIKLSLVEIKRDDLLHLLRERVPSAHYNR